jgi:anti-sigma B factor antagonist
MEITFEEQGKVTIIKIAGNLDGRTSQEAQDKIIPLIVPDCLLVFDMEKCMMISSAGLRVLLMFAKQIKVNGGKGALSGLTEEVRDVMKMTGFDNIFDSFSNLSEAIDSVIKGH